jgi:hypothetical protein
MWLLSHHPYIKRLNPNGLEKFKKFLLSLLQNLKSTGYFKQLFTLVIITKPRAKLQLQLGHLWFEQMNWHQIMDCLQANSHYFISLVKPPGFVDSVPMVKMNTMPRHALWVYSMAFPQQENTWQLNCIPCATNSKWKRGFTLYESH